MSERINMEKYLCGKRGQHTNHLHIRFVYVYFDLVSSVFTEDCPQVKV